MCIRDRLGNDRDRQFFTGQIGTGQFEKNGIVGIIVDNRRGGPGQRGRQLVQRGPVLGSIGVRHTAGIVIAYGRHECSFLMTCGLMQFGVAIRGSGDTPFGSQPH